MMSLILLENVGLSIHNRGRAASDWASKMKSETNNNLPDIKDVQVEKHPGGNR